MSTVSQPCSITNCEETSHVLCYCCNKNLCLDHLPNHRTLIDFQSFSLVEQVNILNEQLKKLDHEKLIDDGRKKLEKWRDESLKKISRFYEQKCEELDRYVNQNIHQKQSEIEQLHKKLIDSNQKQNTIYENNEQDLKIFIFDIKQKVDNIEQKGIPIHIYSLPINNHLITIGELKFQEFNITTLSTSSPYQTFDCSNKFGSSLSTNDQYLLIDQNPFLTLCDSNLNIIQQISWKYGIIYDICWSSSLSSFIIITDKSKAYLVNGFNLSINSIESMHNQLWISCICNHSLLYLASLSNGIVEFSLLPTISYIKRWDPPMTCQNNESIKDISCNELIIALIISPNSNKMVYLILRSLTTFNQLFLIDLNIKNPLYQLPIRCCSFKNNQWLIIDANTSSIFHIGKDGKIKGTFIYDKKPFNAILFNSNILAIRTEENINFHELSSLN